LVERRSQSRRERRTIATARRTHCNNNFTAARFAPPRFDAVEISVVDKLLVEISVVGSYSKQWQTATREDNKLLDDASSHDECFDECFFFSRHELLSFACGSRASRHRRKQLFLCGGE
jgi:hypothetical protein